MKSTFTTIVTLGAAFLIGANAKECSDSECVRLFRGSDCQPEGQLVDFVPTCDSSCFRFSSFDSIDVSGSLFEGTDCHVFSDANCQNEIADTGNVQTNKCLNTAGAQSAVCFFDC
ncbi:hypothetical protein MKEN_00728600 [Mycena kentingensis (nom. inval.)]|nr:hypothetical protein MKEN_00728600 [Mycena kentingensis (nom. inval.)]